MAGLPLRARIARLLLHEGQQRPGGQRWAALARRGCRCARGSRQGDRHRGALVDGLPLRAPVARPRRACRAEWPVAPLRLGNAPAGIECVGPRSRPRGHGPCHGRGISLRCRATPPARGRQHSRLRVAPVLRNQLRARADRCIARRSRPSRRASDRRRVTPPPDKRALQNRIAARSSSASSWRAAAGPGRAGRGGGGLAAAGGGSAPGSSASWRLRSCAIV